MNFDARIGCIRQIEVGYNPAYSILWTNQFIELNENRTVDCKRSMLVNNNSVRVILSLKTNDPGENCSLWWLEKTQLFGEEERSMYVFSTLLC